MPVDLHAALGDLGRRRHELGPAFRPEQLVRHGVAGDHRRDGDRVGADEVTVVDHLRPAKEIGVAPAREDIGGRVEPGRGAGAEIDDRHLAGLGFSEQHRADAADAAHPGLGDADREGGRDRRIDGVTAAAKHFGPDLGSDPVMRRDDAVRTGDGGLPHALTAGEILRQGAAIDQALTPPAAS
jgi:hypothetical protein